MEISNFAGIDLDAPPPLASTGVHPVPLVRATAEALAGLGRIVTAYDPTDVQIVPWPRPGWRPLVAGTGVEGGVVSGLFEMAREGELLYAHNHAVARRYVTGWYADPATARADAEPQRRDRVYTHEANYHPDGGQIFWPHAGAAFVALLAPPGDDVRPESFRAYLFEGVGVHIDPGVWHQPVFPVGDAAVFDDAQGRVHACVSVDFVGEFGCYLEVPLR